MRDRIQLVDDEPSVHEVVRAYLEREGFDVAVADNGGGGSRWRSAHSRS